MKPKYKLGMMLSGTTETNETVSGVVSRIQIDNAGVEYRINDEYVKEESIITAFREIKPRAARTKTLKTRKAKGKSLEAAAQVTN